MKLIDFGLAKELDANGRVRTGFAGTVSRPEKTNHPIKAMTVPVEQLRYKDISGGVHGTRGGQCSIQTRLCQPCLRPFQLGGRL